MAFSKTCSFCGLGDWEACIVATGNGCDGLICKECLRRATAVAAKGAGDHALLFMTRGLLGDGQQACPEWDE